MKILVTGASGFIGKKFCSEAKKKGHYISEASRYLDCSDNFNFIGIYDAVVHLAASGVKHDEHRNWNECFPTNFFGTKRLLEAIKQLKLAPIVYIASTIRATQTEDRLELWNDPYVVSKKLARLYAIEWGKNYSGKLIIDDLDSCYGPGQLECVVNSIIEALEMYNSIKNNHEDYEPENIQTC